MDPKVIAGSALALPFIVCFQLFLVGVASIIAFFIVRKAFKVLSGWGQEIKAEADRLISQDRTSMVKSNPTT